MNPFAAVFARINSAFEFAAIPKNHIILNKLILFFFLKGFNSNLGRT